MYRRMTRFQLRGSGSNLSVATAPFHCSTRVLNYAMNPWTVLPEPTPSESSSRMSSRAQSEVDELKKSQTPEVPARPPILPQKRKAADDLQPPHRKLSQPGGERRIDLSKIPYRPSQQSTPLRVKRDVSKNILQRPAAPFTPNIPEYVFTRQSERNN